MTILYLPVKNTTQNTYYATIQAAINAAALNDVIDVCAGTYNEQITIGIPLTVTGAGAATTFIDESGSSTAGIVTMSGVSGNVTLSGFSILTGDASAVASNAIHPWKCRRYD